MMTPEIAAMSLRLDTIGNAAPRNLDIEAKAGEWIKYLMAHHFESDNLWSNLGEDGLPLLATAESLTLAPPKPPFPDVQTEIAFYLGSARTALEQLLDQSPGTAQRRAWKNIAKELVAEADATVLRLSTDSASAQKRLGAVKTNARFAEARALAVQIAQQRWDAWMKQREGYCPRMTEMIKEIKRVIAADLGRLGLSSIPTRDTISQWLKQDCAIPPEASQGGQRKRNA